MIEQILTTADAVLSRKSKFESAIQNEVAGLAELIANRLQSERNYRRAESTAAIGEPSPDLAKLKKAADNGTAALREAGLRLNGFRSQVGEMGEDFVGCYDTLADELPRHNARVVESFAGEWQTASTTWALMLGRRHAIESLLGTELDLNEPVPTTVTLSADTTRPSEMLLALEKSLKSIAGGKALAERPVSPSYSAAAVYRMTSDRMTPQGISRGAFVVDATFRSGELARLLEFKEARPVLDRDLAKGVVIAAKKSKEIEGIRAAKEFADSERRLHVNSDNVSTRRLDLEGERNFKPSKADLDKTAADIATGIEAGAAERERQRVIDESLNEAADRDEARAAKSAEQKRTPPTADPKPEWPDALH